MDARESATLAPESLAEFLSSVEILSPFTPDELKQLALHTRSRFFAFGDTICNAGEAAEGLFVIRSGSVRVFAEQEGKEISMGVRKVRDVFAEIAMLRDYRHESSVRASAKTELLFIPRTIIAPIIARNPSALAFVASFVAIGAAGGFVTRLFDLRGKVERSELEEFVRSVGEKRIGVGKEILKQDAREDRRLYVVRHGEVRIVRDEEGTQIPLATLRQGEIFGEKACLMRQEQMASALAGSDATLLVIPEKTMHFILERNPKLREVLEERIASVDRELQRQRKLADVTTQGATLDSLARAGESLSFITRGVQCTYEPMLGFELPFIAHWEGYHFVVVYGASKRHVWVADPAAGFKKMSVEEFERGWSGTCLVFTPGRNMHQMAVSCSPWVRFVGYLKPYKKILLNLFLATFVIQMLGIAPPVIIQNILDGVIVHENVNLLHLLIGGLIISNVFTQIMATVRAFLANFMVRNLDFAMMSQFFRHTMSLPYGFFATRKTGDVFARFQENQTIRAFLTESTVTTVLNLLMVFIYFTIMFLYNVKLTLLLIAFVIPIVALTVLVTPKIKNYAREVFSVSTEAKSFLMEALGGVETVKGMGIERPLRLKWEKKYASALDVQYRAQCFNILVGLGGQLLNAATTIAILWVGANLVLAHELTVGQLIAFTALMGCVLAPLMGLVGYVMQSNLLFSGTIAENIACGGELPDRPKIEAVARTADAHAFISKMPLAYEQVVGERGMGLSGGQIQRLCIARALYRDPRLLIFDEATSALDTQSESHIIGNMHEILKGRTAVIVAHRLSTIMRADKILVLHQGAIVEQGRHEDLVEGKKGMYYQLVQKQLSAA